MKKKSTIKPLLKLAGALLALAVLVPRQAQAQLSIAADNTPYTITFDATMAGVNDGAYAGAGFAPVPTAGQLNSNAWATTGMSDGASAFGATATAGDFARGTNAAAGGTSTGGYYAFTAPNIGSPSFGIKPGGSDWTPGTVTLRVQNTTGAALTSLDVAYALWCNNSQPRSNSFNFSWSTDDATYTNVPSLDFTSIAAADGLGYAVNNKSTTITSLNVANNGYIYLRWSGDDVGGSGNRDEFSLDDISVTANGASGPNTSIEFQDISGSVAENAGSTSLTVAITDPSTINATSVDVVLTGGNAARIDNYTTQTITFPPDDGEQVAVALLNITVTDNADCDADEVLTFQLQNITGGQGTPFIGSNDTFTLTVVNNETPADPVTTAASGIAENGFTANWDAVPGATGYFLDVSTSPNFGIYTHDTISEGFDGGRNTLPSGWTQTGLGTDYTSSGNYGLASPSLKFDDSNDQLVSATFTGPADSISFWYKGQATAGSASALLTEGWNGSNWVTIGTLTNIANNAIGTQKYILNPNDGFVQFRLTYTKVTGNLSFDDFNVYYTFGTPDFVLGYQNLSVSGTSQAVVGLDPLTTYYYRVRSTGGCSTGGNSNVTNVTTLAGINPALGASSLADFGNICLNADGGPGSFTITGSNLTSTDVTVGPLAGFTFSTSELGTYVASLTISQPGGSFSQEVWVKFTPTLEQSYNGNIPIGGGGAPSIDATALGAGINTAASMSTVGTSNIGENQVNAHGTIDSEGCSSLTEYGIEYSTTQGFTPGTGTQVPSTNEINGAYFSVLSGLSPCTVYYFLAYGTNNGGTTYGAEGSFETSPISAPVATVPVTVNSNNFTATWDAVPGGTGYRLDVSTSSTFGNSVPASGLFFSEYVEGGSNNKYVEVFNGTGSTVNLANYALQLFANGASSPTVSDTLSGTLADGAVMVYANSSAVAYGGAVVVSSAVNFNGDDAFALVNVTNSTYADIIGTIGEDPGSAWTGAGGRSTSNKTLVRNDNVHGGVTTNPVTGFPTLETEWAVYNQDDVGHLGTHSFNSIIPYFLPGYEDLAVAGTSQLVSGLNTSTTYYYRVRAESGACVSGNSNTIPVTTLACPGNAFVVSINLDGNGDQISWEVLDDNNVSIVTGGPYTGQGNTLVTETVCIGNAPVSACYGFHLYDSFGDGLSGVGNWQLRTTDGKVLLGDVFATGYSSPSFTPASPGYGSNHSFCLPPGPANIAATECGIFNNQQGNKVYCNKVTGATQYQFEFSDPDAGFIRRIVRTTNYVHFWDMVSNPLVPGVHYFARVRTNVAGPVASAHWGSGCEMGLANTVPCSQLIPSPNYGHSCNETRAFNSNSSFIYATPVAGASQYQFRIFNTGEGYDQTFTRNTYILQLKWNNNVAPPLMNGSTYDVQVNVKVGNTWSGFCGSTCTITIDNGGNNNAFANMDQASFGETTLWPNPVRDGQVNLNIGGLQDATQQIAVDVQDIYGKQVFAKAYGNSGDRFSTILQLPSDIASGVYMVNITVNGKRTVQRLSIVR